MPSNVIGPEMINMKNSLNILRVLVSNLVVISLVGGVMSVNIYEMYNPYAPHNRIAAEPGRPYTPWMTPKISRTYYRPLPVCAPTWLIFPDSPKITEPVMGPFQIPAPTP